MNLAQVLGSQQQHHGGSMWQRSNAETMAGGTKPERKGRRFHSHSSTTTGTPEVCMLIPWPSHAKQLSITERREINLKGTKTALKSLRVRMKRRNQEGHYDQKLSCIRRTTVSAGKLSAQRALGGREQTSSASQRVTLMTRPVMVPVGAKRSTAGQG